MSGHDSGSPSTLLAYCFMHQPYARRSKSLEVLIPILYLNGVSTGDFEEALVALLGKDAGGLSAATVGQLKEAWSEEHEMDLFGTTRSRCGSDLH